MLSYDRKLRLSSRVVGRDLKSLQSFITDKLAATPNVANLRSSIALKQVKYKTALPIDIE